MFEYYKEDLQFYIDQLWSKKLELNKFLSSKELPNNKISHSQWKQIIYKNASEIIRSALKKEKTSKPQIDKISINIDSRIFDIKSNNNKEFDLFIRIKTPFFYTNKKRSISICLPVRQHKHSLKYQTWNRKNTIRLTKSPKGYFYLTFFYEKDIELKQNGTELGIDIGYKKLLVTSDNQILGREMESIYQKLSKKKQGSKNFKQLLLERNKKINEVCNNLDLSNTKLIILENLKNLKFKTKQNKTLTTPFMRKFQYCLYPKVIQKIRFLSEENGILLEQVAPQYTSQMCSRCGFIHSDNRRGELFKCINCGNEIDADSNASVNIRNRGVYNPSVSKTS
jgi:IS605 OrfB family transposase